MRNCRPDVITMGLRNACHGRYYGRAREILPQTPRYRFEFLRLLYGWCAAVTLACAGSWSVRFLPQEFRRKIAGNRQSVTKNIVERVVSIARSRPKLWEHSRP